MKSLSVIIVAGGAGVRMGGDVPKQFLVVRGRPILMHSIDAFKMAGQIIVVLPSQQVEYWKRLCSEYDFATTHQIVAGGSERFYSVRNGLTAVLPTMKYVAIHDGVRPWVTRQVIDDALDTATKFGAAIPVINVTDSIRMMSDDEHSKSLDRKMLRAVQTPQIFERDIILRAYERGFSDLYTDDASVVESAGYSIALSEGSVANIKITVSSDLQ